MPLGSPGEYRPRRTGRLFVTLTQTTARQTPLRGVVCVKSALWWAWSILARGIQAGLWKAQATTHLPARCVLKPTVLSEILQNQGGQLPYSGGSHPHECLVAQDVRQAAKAVAKFAVRPEHVLVLDDPGTDT